MFLRQGVSLFEVCARRVRPNHSVLVAVETSMKPLPDYLHQLSAVWKYHLSLSQFRCVDWEKAHSLVKLFFAAMHLGSGAVVHTSCLSTTMSLLCCHQPSSDCQCHPDLFKFSHVDCKKASLPGLLREVSHSSCALVKDS